MTLVKIIMGAVGSRVFYLLEIMPIEFLLILRLENMHVGL